MVGPRLTLAAAALLLAGCGIDVTPLGDPTPSAEPSSESPSETSSPEASGAPGSTPVVRQAVRRLLAARTGRVTTTLTVGPLRVTDDARYDITRGFTIRRQMGSADGVVAVEGTVIEQDLWYRLLAPQELSCWIHTTADALSGFSTRSVAYTPAAAAPRQIVPSGINVLSTFRGTGEPDVSGNHPGTTRLAMVVELLGQPALEAAGLSRRDRTRVEASLRIVNDEITTLKVEGDALAAGLEEADADLPGGEGAPMQALISFSLKGTDVPLAPPAPSSIVELTQDQEQFEQDLTACERAQP